MSIAFLKKICFMYKDGVFLISDPVTSLLILATPEQY